MRCSQSWFEAPPASTETVEAERADDTKFPPGMEAPPAVTRGPQRIRPIPPGSNLPALPQARRRSWDWAGWVLLLLAVIGGFVGGIGYRNQIVALWPPAEQLYVLASLPIEKPPHLVLKIRTIKSEHLVERGKKYLKVTGGIFNTGNKHLPAPRLSLMLLDSGQKVVARWTAILAASEIGPGETASFTTKLADPPKDGRNISIAFFKEP